MMKHGAGKGGKRDGSGLGHRVPKQVFPHGGMRGGGRRKGRR